MKLLFLLAFAGLSMMAESPQTKALTDHGLEMQINTEMDFPEMVKIYDYQGNLVQELLLSEVVNNEISISDYMMLEDSDYAFNYLGDYYYFTGKDYQTVFN